MAYNKKQLIHQYYSIYIVDLLKIFDLHKNKSQAIAFADDLIVYSIDNWLSRIQEILQDTFRKIEYYYLNVEITH